MSCTKNKIWEARAHPKRETDRPERSLSNCGEWRTGITTPKQPQEADRGEEGGNGKRKSRTLTLNIQSVN